MRTVTRWGPVGELVSLQEMMDRVFEDSFVRSPDSPTDAIGARTLPIDLHETPDEFVLSASVPGMKAEELDITVTGDSLQIKGEPKGGSETNDSGYIKRERHYGAFYRRLDLPSGVERGKAEAKFENGVLTLTLPKAEGIKPKQIRINVN